MSASVALALLAAAFTVHAEIVLRVSRDLGNGAALTIDLCDPNRFLPGMNGVYEGLAAFDAVGRPAPRLAAGWMARDNMKTCVFALKPALIM